MTVPKIQLMQMFLQCSVVYHRLNNGCVLAPEQCPNDEFLI